MDYLTLFVSLRCTQSCKHCLYGCSPYHGEHMSWDVFIKSISIAQEKRIPTLNLFGGEPLLNPRFFPMLQTALTRGFSLILATNCRPLAKEKVFKMFLKTTEQYKAKINIVTARDKFHLEHFDPAEVIIYLQIEGYNVIVNNYSNETIALTEHNVNNPELRRLDTSFSCCEGTWTDYLGILPAGGWTLCPASLQTFGDIFSRNLDELIEFKHKLPINYRAGCSRCLKDFKDFHRKFIIEVTSTTLEMGNGL